MLQNFINQLKSQFLYFSENFSDIVILLSGIIIAFFIVEYLVKFIIEKIVHSIIKKTKNEFDDILFESKFFSRLSLLVPGIMTYYSAGILSNASLKVFIERITLAFITLICILSLDSVLNVVQKYGEKSELSRKHAIKSYMQMLKLALYLCGIIVIFAVILNKSPWKLLTAIGAFGMVVMLIFKDSILGLVASFQLSAQKMVKNGDWIEMPQYGADGDVIDVTLNTVKVQNWDKTISMIPTHALVSNSFKNWEGMTESGGRRIMRSVKIDINSIKFCDEEMLDRFEEIEYISEYLKKKRKEVKDFNNSKKIDTENFLVNGRHLTNIGTFRAYLKGYLRNHPKINMNLTFLIRQLPPEEKGLPIQIYVFTNDTVWASYEDIQADIFDHVLAIIPLFELKVYQFPSGKDFTEKILNK